MNKITSFTVDHLKLKKGLYVSRVDHLGETVITTYDLRMKKPNVERLNNESIHTLEHLLATFFRNDLEYGGKIVYFGPMGCLTGMYLLVNGEWTSKEILPFVVKALEFVLHFKGDIPGVSPIECGTFKLHDLDSAKREARAYLEVLKNATEDQLIYPV